MVARLYLQVGYPHRSKVVKVTVGDTRFCMVYDGENLAVRPCTSDKPVTRIKVWPSR